MIFQPGAAELIDAAVLRELLARQPHVVNAFGQRGFHLSARIHIAQVAVKQYFNHHSGMVSSASS